MLYQRKIDASARRAARVQSGNLELLERRAMLSATASPDFGSGFKPAPPTTTVYVESNNPQAGQNAVLELQPGSNGALHQVGTFLTAGTGQANPTQGLGPDDPDKQVIASSDGRFLFAVNQGSNSVAVFQINSSGSLNRVGTFDSGGVQPVALALDGDTLYVTNRGNALQGQTATAAPSYNAFRVVGDGVLVAIPNSSITLPLGLSPTQELVSPDGDFVFGDNFAIPGTAPTLGNTLDPFIATASGRLIPAAGGPVSASVSSPTLLGLAANPNYRIVYGGLVVANELAVFAYGPNGSAQFLTAVSDQGNGACWLQVSADGKYLYASNTGSDAIGVFSLADPINPVQIQEFKLSQPAPPAGATTVPTASFEIQISPDGKSLAAITQSTAADLNFPQGNAVHYLTIAKDGTLSEPNAALTFPTSEVPGTARIQGVAIVQGQSNGFGNFTTPNDFLSQVVTPTFPYFFSQGPHVDNFIDSLFDLV